MEAVSPSPTLSSHRSVSRRRSRKWGQRSDGVSDWFSPQHHAFNSAIQYEEKTEVQQQNKKEKENLEPMISLDKTINEQSKITSSQRSHTNTSSKGVSLTISPPRYSNNLLNGSRKRKRSLIGTTAHNKSSQLDTSKRRKSVDSYREYLIVTDSLHIGALHFGNVIAGCSKSLSLRLVNPSDAGSARIKYEGCSKLRILTHNNNEQITHSIPNNNRFTCDLHVAAIPAEKHVTLRVSFSPKQDDKEGEITGVLIFKVNDSIAVKCRVSGATIPNTTKKHVSKNSATELPKAISSQSFESVFPPCKRTPPRVNKNHSRNSSLQSTLLNSDTTDVMLNNSSTSFSVGTKRSRLPQIDENNDFKRSRHSHTLAAITIGFSNNTQKNNSKPSYSDGSWWSKRKIINDENWMAKQEEGFMKWINYVLIYQKSIPDDDYEENNVEFQHESKSHLKSFHNHFDFTSLRTLAQQRMETKWLRAVQDIFQSDGLKRAAVGLQDDIAKKRLQVRSDRPIYADLGLQDELIAVLNQYHPAWLRLGLEVVLGSRTIESENFSHQSMLWRVDNQNIKKSKHQKMPSILRRIILQHVIHDRRLAKKYAIVKNLKAPVDVSIGANTSAFGYSKKNNVTGREYFIELMECFTLKFLMLVLLLDKAAGDQRSGKFAQFPCLFRKTGEKKHSLSIVTEFCRLCLSREGRIEKHLREVGYVLTYEQTPMDEVDLEIKNIAIDLRDGVRLAKLIEALTTGDSNGVVSQKALSTYLRAPALSRLQKVHNVEVCLHFLQERCGLGVLDSLLPSLSSSFASVRAKENERMVTVLAKDIVDGHREKTLALLWQLIANFQLQALVNTKRLQLEIEQIKRRMSFRVLEFYNQHASITEPEDENDVMWILLEWCRAVTANYFLSVENFSTSFTDGKILCCLVHFYHPMLLRKNEIFQTNERKYKNKFALVNERVKMLGEIPVLMPEYYDESNIPDDKMVMTFVCYLQSRLMDSSKEIHAASRLKRWWKGPYIRSKLLRKRFEAAKRIQRLWYSSTQKRLMIRRCQRLLRAGRVVKAMLISWPSRRLFLVKRHNAITLQRWFRWILRERARKEMKLRKEMRKKRLQEEELKSKHETAMKIKRKAEMIENCWIQYKNRIVWRNARQLLIQRLNAASSVIQKFWRNVLQRYEAKRQQMMHLYMRNAAAKRIIHFFRRIVEAKRMARMALQEMLAEKNRLAIAAKQKQAEQRRREQAALEQVKIRRNIAAIQIQSIQRRRKARNVFLESREAVIVLQRSFRVWLARLHVNALKNSRRLQRQRELEQMRQSKLKDIIEKRAIRTLQCVMKRYTESHKMKVAKENAVLKIQATYRGTMICRYYHYIRMSAIIIQCTWRMYAVRSTFVQIRQHAVKIQSWFRGSLSRQKKHIIGHNFYTYQVQKRWWTRRYACWKIEYWYSAWKDMSFMKQVELQRQIQIFAAKAIRHNWRTYQLKKEIARRVACTQYLKRQKILELHKKQLREQEEYKRKQNFAGLVILRCWKSYRLRKDLESRIQQSQYRIWKECMREHSSVEIIKRVWCKYRLKKELANRITRTKRKQEALQQRKIQIEQRRKERLQFDERRLKRILAAAATIKRVWKSYRLRSHIKIRSDQQRYNKTWGKIHSMHASKFEPERLKKLNVHQNKSNALSNRGETGRGDVLKTFRDVPPSSVNHRLQSSTNNHNKMMRQAGLRIVQWLKCCIDKHRFQQTHGYVTKIQAWWRGTKVRLHKCSNAVTRQRKKLVTMRLVPLNSYQESQVDESIPLGSRLEHALKILLNSSNLQDMLIAAHAIATCTLYSRECCKRCISHRIPALIIAAISGLNRSQPHMELLYQLLLILANLTGYNNNGLKLRLKKEGKKLTRDDALELTALVDILQIHRDSQHIVRLAAGILQHSLKRWRIINSLADSTPMKTGLVSCWREAEHRLAQQRELAVRRVAQYNALAKATAIVVKAGGNSIKFGSEVDPKYILTTLNELLKLMKGIRTPEIVE